VTDQQPIAPAAVAGLPSDPITAMAGLLTGHGLTVHSTGREDSRLKVTGARSASCEVTVDEDGYLTCEISALRRNPASSGISTAGMASIVALMLAVPAASPQQYSHLHRAVTPAGAVGREMEARGMTVTMDVFEDHQAYSVSAVVVITSPAHPGRGTVHLDNNGFIYWETDTSQTTGGPPRTGRHRRRQVPRRDLAQPRDIGGEMSEMVVTVHNASQLQGGPATGGHSSPGGRPSQQ
jgi:hypothetical protein